MEFLLLEGVEPDNHWNRFAGAVRQLIERYNVTLTIGVHGIPMGVPHTRPLGMTVARDAARAGDPLEHLGRRDASPRERGDDAPGPPR